MSELRVGVCGLGFMGRTHFKAWQAQEGARVVAVSDKDRAAREGAPASSGNLGSPDRERLFAAGSIRGHATAEALFEDPEVDAVSLCTPTPSHVPLAEAALRAGKHVLVEKPVALHSADVQRLAAVARSCGRVCMPAHCIRFWPAYAWLLEVIASGEHGAVRSAVFTRVGAPPSWSRAFYSDSRQSGGAMVDLHVHDADFQLAAFGPVRGVWARGHRDHVLAIYERESGPALVAAEGGWLPGAAFSMRWRVTFERAHADFVFARDPELLLAVEGAEPRAVTLDARDGYFHEVKAFAAAVREGREPPVTLRDAAEVARLLEAEARALEDPSGHAAIEPDAVEDA